MWKYDKVKEIFLNRKKERKHIWEEKSVFLKCNEQNYEKDKSQRKKINKLTKMNEEQNLRRRKNHKIEVKYVNIGREKKET